MIWSIEEIKRLQDTDRGYKIIKEMIKEGAKMETIMKNLKEEKQNARLPLAELRLESDVLYREIISPYGEKVKAVILSVEYISKALSLVHSSPMAGHRGVKVTLNRAQKLAFWPGMKRDVEEYCKKCMICCRYKSIGNAYPAPRRHYPDVSAPFERIHMHLVGPMGTSDKGKKYILTVIDVFT